MKHLAKLKNIFLFLLGIGLGTAFLLYLIACVWIGWDVKEQCKYAQGTYEGNCTTALMYLVKDNNQSFRNRNSAIWALGQLGDPQALPILQSLYTGMIPDREPLDAGISQYELKKAINLVNGGTNISAPVWRYGFK
jgi:hypothetical protein